MTDVGTLTLSDFLLARIAEDEALAREDQWDHLVPRWVNYVLAECEAKRRIAGLHSDDHECSTYDHNGEVDNCTWVIGGDCSTMRLLALPYRDHPDYRSEWAV